MLFSKLENDTKRGEEETKSMPQVPVIDLRKYDAK
jgi:hypothetical protein